MFKKSIIAIAILAATITTASAQHRGRFGHFGDHRHGINPWVAGAVGLGILGAGVYVGSRYYDRVCWHEHVGYDAWGRPVYRRICE